MSARRFAVLLATTALCAAAAAPALADELADAGAREIEGVTVEGERAASSVANGLELTIRDTPQSVSVISEAQIDDFALTNVNELLAQVVGVNVEKVETDRTYYNSRGFDITNFQVDGVGLPLIWGIQFGDLDTALFERVEVLRGANGLAQGLGNPSATINYVRKRPTKTFQGELSAQYGSWDAMRLEADVSGPLNASGSLAGRLVYANEDRDSYLDHYGVNRNVYYGVVSWDATSRLNLSAGYSRQDNRARGVLWGALPLVYSDGTLIDYPTSASTSADWTYWQVIDEQMFGEAELRLGEDWRLKAVATYKRFEENAKLLYAYGNPDPVTGEGIFGMSGIYPSTYDQYMLDVYAAGPVRLFGRTHRLVVGAHASRAESEEYENFSPATLVYPALGRWGAEQVAEPDYPGAYLAADQSDRMQRLYAAAHLDLSDRVKAVVGFNALWLESEGVSYSTDMSRDDAEVSPYAGVTVELSPHVSVYASYTDIFNPQSEIDVTRAKLEPAHGKSYEAGIKSQWFDGRFSATAAIFKSEQFGLAEYAGTFPDGKNYYAGLDTFVEGYELEVAGQVTDRWSLSGGWTHMEVEGEDGADVRTYIPRKTLKLATTYQFPELRDLQLGAAVRWQDDIHIEDIVTIPQDAYAVFDLMAAVDLTDQVRATLNVKNVTDEAYLTSLQWNQSYYGAPRSVSLRLSYSF